MSKDVTITLNVKADELYTATVNNNNTAPTDLSPYCSLGDNSDLHSSGSGTNFETNVFYGHSVTWQAQQMPQVSANGYTLGIDSITEKPNSTDMFSSDTLHDQNGTITSANAAHSGSTVTATVNAAPQNPNSNTDETYTINFSVYSPTNVRLAFSLDPKLQGNR